MASQLEQLKRYSTISCDTANASLIKKFGARDATTNPSLVLKVTQEERYVSLLRDAIYWGLRKEGKESDVLNHIQDRLLVSIGTEILKEVPGRVSTEIDARISFDADAMVNRALAVMSLYKEMGVSGDRVLIKLPGTWEGLEAARILESRGIHCNVTLVFHLMQAVVAADAKVTLISPFVGRIYDWWIARHGKEGYQVELDPGVISVKTIYSYYKRHKIPTQVMAASFRTKEQILELAGCDLLTISPKLLEELQASESPVERKLSEELGSSLEIEEIPVAENIFRYLLNEDAMTTEKLAEGIRLFVSDTHILETSLMETIRQISANA